jgi:hypothetical protein
MKVPVPNNVHTWCPDEDILASQAGLNYMDLVSGSSEGKKVKVKFTQ